MIQEDELTFGQERLDPSSGSYVVCRLRDLDHRGRWLVLAVALSLLVAPLLAFAIAVPDWAPAGDSAVMGLRALDVGTSHTPLIGQPSSAAFYVEEDLQIHHAGATHFYLLALPVRLLGGGIGMLLVSTIIVGACVVIAAWAAFRELGLPAAVIAAVVLAAIMFTTGVSSLINPVSSSIAGYPLLCSAVLLWCLLCGDLRLLPLTTAVVSFAAQQHLSVGPAVVVLTAGTVTCLVISLARQSRWRDPRVRRQLLRWSGWSVVVAFLMWAPVLLDQLVGEGNLGRLAEYIGSGKRETLGVSSAVYQVVHALGLPPLLGQTDFSGSWLTGRPSILTWLSAFAVVAAVAGLGIRWRKTNSRKAMLVVLLGITVIAGLANGSSVPIGFEQARPAFYHWSFIVAFFTALILSVGVLDLVRSHVAARRWLAPALTSMAVVVIITVPSAVNPALDRDTNTFEPVRGWKSEHFDKLRDAVLAHRAELGAQTVMLRGQLAGFHQALDFKLTGFTEALAFALAEKGLDVRHSRSMRGFVHDDRLVERSTVTSGLVVVVNTQKGQGIAPPGGKLLTEINLRPTDIVDARNGRDVRYTGIRLYLVEGEDLARILNVEQALMDREGSASVTDAPVDGRPHAT